jgi:hypothetical protein
MSKQFVSWVSVGVAAVAFAGAANAIPIQFTIDGASASTSGIGIGSTISVTPSAGVAHSFWLDTDGVNSTVFNFLDVTVSGVGAVAGVINAELDFSKPGTASADGVLGGFGVVLGLVSGGGLTTLNGTVTAKVTLLKAPTTSVPEPATLSLLGAGLVAFGLSRRRKRPA